MRKTLYTLNIGNYAPHITQLTYPLFRRYAEKIGAEFVEITERKFPAWPVVYEKLQIYELGRDNDWNIYVDADAVIHPDMFDPTDHIQKDTVMHNGRDMAGNRWRYDRFFRRDGRHIGSCNWFTIASDWCIDLWRPLEITLHEALKNIYPVRGEVLTGLIEPGHLIDDYTLSRNIAQFGFKFDTVLEMQARMNDKGNYLFHLYNLPEGVKLQKIGDFLMSTGMMKMAMNY